MKTQVSRWGNSLAVRLPAAVVQEMKLQEGTVLELQSGKAGMLLRKTQPRYVLNDLLKQVTAENRHGEDEWGQPAGHEVW